MRKTPTASEKQLLAEVKRRAEALQAELNAKKTTKTADGFIKIKIQKSQARYKRAEGHGEFFLALDVTARKDVIYLPLSIGSSSKPTGFLYYIEGTATGSIYRADVTCRGESVTKITVGTLTYVRIPPRKTGRFRILVKTKGKTGKVYKIVLSRINYKLTLHDSRYQRFETKINSKRVKFS